MSVTIYSDAVDHPLSARIQSVISRSRPGVKQIQFAGVLVEVFVAPTGPTH